MIYKKILLSIFALLFIGIANTHAQKLTISFYPDALILDISPDGNYALIDSDNKAISLWNIKEGRLIRLINKEIRYPRFTPDQKHLIYCSGSSQGGNKLSLKLIDLETGELVKEFKQSTRIGKDIIFSPDQKYVLTVPYNRSDSIRIWDLNTGDLISTLPHNSNRDYYNIYKIDLICFSPDSKTVINRPSSNVFKLWDVETGVLLKTFTGHKNDVKSISISHNGKYVLSGSVDRTVKLWNIKSGELLNTFVGHTNHVLSVCFSPDDRFILSTSKDEIILWSIEEKKMISKFHHNNIHFSCFTSEGDYIISQSEDETKKWSIKESKLLKTLSHYNYEPGVFTPDNKYFLATDYRIYKLYDIDKFSLINTFEGTPLAGQSINISSGGQYVTYWGNADGYVFDINTGEIVRCNERIHSTTIVSTKQSNFELNKSRQVNILSTYTKPQTYRYMCENIYSRHSLGLLNGFSQKLYHYHECPYGIKQYSNLPCKSIELWDVDSNKIIKTIKDTGNYINWFCFTPDENILFTSQNNPKDTVKQYQLYNISNDKFTISDTISKDIYPIAFSPDGRYVVAINKYPWKLEIRNASDYSLISEIPDSLRISAVSFSYNGKYLGIISENGSTHLIKIDSGELLWKNESFTANYSLSFTKDNKYIITPCYTGGVKLLSVENGKEIATYYYFASGEWVVIRTNGFYNASEGAKKYLHYVDGLKIIPIESYKNDPNYKPKLFEDLFYFKDSIPIESNIEYCFHDPKYNTQQIGFYYNPEPSRKDFLLELENYWNLNQISVSTQIDFGYEYMNNPLVIDSLVNGVKNPELIREVEFMNMNAKSINVLLSHFSNVEKIVISNSYQFESKKAKRIDKKHSDTIPKMIFECKKLKDLYIFDECFKFIPNEINHLANLEKLTLYCSDLISLPETLNGLTNLKEFRLYESQINKLPTFDSLIKLETFQLHCPNVLDYSSLNSLTNLHSLFLYDIKHNSLRGNFDNLQKLELIHLYSKASEFPNFINTAPNLSYLTLSLPNIKHFNKILIKSQNLKQLIIRDCKNPIQLPDMFSDKEIDELNFAYNSNINSLGNIEKCNRITKVIFYGSAFHSGETPKISSLCFEQLSKTRNIDTIEFIGYTDTITIKQAGIIKNSISLFYLGYYSSEHWDELMNTLESLNNPNLRITIWLKEKPYLGNREFSELYSKMYKSENIIFKLRPAR